MYLAFINDKGNTLSQHDVILNIMYMIQFLLNNLLSKMWLCIFKNNFKHQMIN